jgi:hypothetical protein
MKARFAQSSATPAEREFLLWITFTDPNLRRPMKSKRLTPKNEPTEAEIQHAAYLLWVEDGRREGCDLQHWLAAKEMLTHRHGRDSTTRQRVPEIPRRTRH